MQISLMLKPGFEPGLWWEKVIVNENALYFFSDNLGYKFSIWNHCGTL